MGLRNTLYDFVQDLHLPRPPFWLVALALIGLCVLLLPFALAARARIAVSSEPRVHLFQDMDAQPRYGAQDYSYVFQDHRAMRPPVPGTVAADEVIDAPHYTQGFTLTQGPDGPTPRYVETIPAGVEVDEDLLLRGQDMYNVYCSPCHGWDGRGNGPVNERALRLAANARNSQGTSWVAAVDLLAAEADGTLRYGPEAYADGAMYNVITNGIRNMPAYGPQIETHDRWAIVAYIRALQISQADRATPAEETQTPQQ